jgi:hypothetical protein
MLTIAAVLIGVLASTKVGAAVAVGVIVLIYFAL